MSIKQYEEQYRSRGFFWNQHLACLVEEYAGREIPYQHHKTNKAMTVRLLPPDSFVVGREYGPYAVTVKYLNEEISPVGDCNERYVQLFLTESGKLIGFADYLLLRWGGDELDWRSSLALLLQGIAPAKIGVIQ